MSRSLTVTWDDPLATLAAAGGMSGLEYLRAIGDGRLPHDRDGRGTRDRGGAATGG
jgi:hypothetical protein